MAEDRNIKFCNHWSVNFDVQFVVGEWSTFLTTPYRLGMSNMVQLHGTSCRITPPHRRTFRVLPSTYPAAARSNPPTSPKVSSRKFLYWHDGFWRSTSCSLEKEPQHCFQLTWTSSSSDRAKLRSCNRPDGEHCIQWFCPQPISTRYKPTSSCELFAIKAGCALTST